MRLVRISWHIQSIISLRQLRTFSIKKRQPPPTISNSNAIRNMASSISSPEVFKGKVDHYRGITINSNETECALDEFQQKLKDSIELWKNEGIRMVWMKVYLDKSDWIPILTKRGFKYHHAKEEFVSMYLWISDKETLNLPPFAHTMLGVGAVVINDNNKILVVRERFKVINRPYWKLPGGFVEPGEDLIDAAKREVLEETGIRTEFKSILTFRHTHSGSFGCSDIYTVVSLKPLSEDIAKCEKEIELCEWMDVDEYLSHPHVHDLNRFFVTKYKEYEKHDIHFDVFHGIHEFLNKPYAVYHVDKKSEKTEHNLKPFNKL